MSGSSEQSLLDRARSGDSDAVAELLEQCGPMLRHRLQGKIPQRWQAMLSEDDVLQETYAEAFQRIGDFHPQGDGSFAAWLAAIARNKLISAIRFLNAEIRGGKAKQVAPPRIEDSSVALHDFLCGSGTTPSQHAARQEICRRVKWAVSQLPDAYARVVELRDLQGLALKEVAMNLGCTPGAAAMRLDRAHEELKRILGSFS